MSDRTLSELAGAEIVEGMGGPNAWVVDFGDGDYDLVNKSAKNTLVLKKGVLSDGQDSFTFGGVSVDIDLPSDEIHLTRESKTVRLPSEKHDHVLWAVYDEDAPRLNKLFEEHWTPTVRKGLMDMLTPRFRHEKEDIKKQENGWLLDNEILLSWDGANHPVNVRVTHIVSGDKTVEADEDKEARTIRFHLSPEREVQLPNGTTTELRDVEMKFLTSAALILGNDGGDLYDDGLAESIENSEIKKFTDTKSGLHHGHSMDKHTLSMLGVTDEASNRLWYNSYDHAGVWEMAIRKDEFINAPIDVFEDAPNDSEAKWDAIQNTKELAPIPKHIRKDLEDRYGS